MADNPLARLPILGQLGIAALVAALIFGGYWYFLHQPLEEEETAKTAKLAKLQADVRNLEVTANKLEEFRREVAVKEQRLETLKRILPADKETPDLMKRVQYLATQANLQIRKFTPGATLRRDFEVAPPPQAGPPGAKPPAPPPGGRPAQPAQATEYYQEWPISVEVDGNYHNMGTFFDRVSRLSRLVTIGTVKIKSQAKQTASNTVNISCVATTYVYVEGPAAGQVAK